MPPYLRGRPVSASIQLSAVNHQNVLPVVISGSEICSNARTVAKASLTLVQKDYVFRTRIRFISRMFRKLKTKYANR